MKIGMQTWGSRGDVVPFIALAAGLHSAGHEVTLAVTTDHDRDYSALEARHGFRIVRVHAGFVDPPLEELQRIVRTPDRIKEVRLLNDYYFDPAVEEMYAASTALCAENDLVIGHFWLHTLMTAAELQRVPRIVLHLCPIGVRSRYTPALGPNLGAWLNGLVWDLGDRVMTRQLFRRADALRVREGLAPVRSLQRQLLLSDELTLITMSPLLCPRQPDWGDDIAITGFLDPPRPGASERLPDALDRFLGAGEPPVYFSFGSCEVFYAEENPRLFAAAIERLGERAIVQTRYTDACRDFDPARVLVVADNDHSRVFPRCKLVVHHGGAGTSQTALRAGVPSLAVEHGFDQTYWGRALVAAGVAPALLHRRSVTPASLAQAIADGIRSDRLMRTAKRLARDLQDEDGVANAVDLIGRRFERVR